MAAALKANGIVALELNISDPKMGETLKAAMAALPASAHQASLVLLERIAAQREKNLPAGGVVAGMLPLLQVMTLMVAEAGRQEYSAMWAQE